MKKPWQHIGLMLTILMVASSCLEPYTPPVPDDNTELLVVDAYVDMTEGVASVSLTHTVPLSSTDMDNDINDAEVKLVDDVGASVLLGFVDDGVYVAHGLNIDATKKYKLVILRPHKKEYESELVPVQVTPAIDDLGWVIDGNYLNVTVSTHDPAGKSRYYRWKFAETWEYNSPYPTSLVVKNDSVVIRNNDEDISLCWRSIDNKNINIYSTDYLVSDAVSDFAITRIPSNSIKLTTRYYILVQQQTLTKEAYVYWLNVKKTTESLGTLFDPLPGSVVGNIHCTSNPSENVIGFFSVGSATEKHLYIDRGELGSFVNFDNPSCLEDTVVCDTVHVKSWYDVHPHYHFENPNIVVAPLTNKKGAVIGYVQTSASCTDCRILSEGTTTKPDFWED